ncbi:MAG: hypothetical protein ACE5JP_02775 [Candidatus Bipolaricaulia bacterium]
MIESHHRFRFIGIVLVAIAVAALGFVLTGLIGDELREWIIEPLIGTALLMKAILVDLPELFVWSLLVALLALAGYGTVLRLFEDTSEPQADAAAPKGVGPVTELIHRISLGRHGAYFTWKVRQRLAELVVDLIAVREGIPTVHARERFTSGRWTSDERVRRFFSGPVRQEKLDRLKQWLDYWKPGLGWDDHGFRGELEWIVEYLETYARGSGSESDGRGR